MNKEKIKKKHNLLIYLTIFIALSLVLTAIFNILTPSEEKLLESDFVIQNYDQTETEFKKVEFTGESILVPEELIIYRPIQNNYQASDLAGELINEYQLAQHQSLKNYWIAENYHLIERIPQTEYVFYDFTKNFLEENTSEFDPNKNLDLDQAINSCLSFYDKYKIDLNFIPQENDIKYMSLGVEPIETSPKDAFSVIIPLTLELDSWPVFYKNEKDFPFYCTIDKNNNIKDIVFKNLFYNFEEVKKMNKISIKEAVNNVSAGKASIIKAKSQIAEIISLDLIIKADLYEVSIDYRYDDDLQIAYPFYHFRANITNSDGLNIKADIITPAVNSEQEK